MKKIALLLFLSCITLVASQTPFSRRIQKEILDAFLSAYPSMHIKKIGIKLLSPLPKQGSVAYERVILTKAALKRAKGSFTLVVRHGQRERKLYGSYTVTATLPVLKSIKPLPADTLLREDLVERTAVPFTYLYKEPIDRRAIGRYRLKHSVKAGKVLTRSDLKRDFAVNRNDYVTARLREGGLIITFRARALENGAPGDIIKIKKGYNTLLKARIIASGEVEVVE